MNIPLFDILPAASFEYAVYSNLAVTEPQNTQDPTKRVTRILDTKYQKADLQSIVRDNCKHLSANQEKKLLQLLKKYESLFDGTLRREYHPTIAELSQCQKSTKTPS